MPHPLDHSVIQIANKLHEYYDAKNKARLLRDELSQIAFDLGMAEGEARKTPIEYLDGYLTGAGCVPKGRDRALRGPHMMSKYRAITRLTERARWLVVQTIEYEKSTGSLSGHYREEIAAIRAALYYMGVARESLPQTAPVPDGTRARSGAVVKGVA